MAVKKKLDQYSGMLTNAQLAEGINAAFTNARRLAEDARLLLENGRYSSAASLAILAIEESGKPRMLRMLAMMETIDACQEHWREYRTHTKKNAHFAFLQSAGSGHLKLSDFQHLFDDDAEHPFVLEQLKQIGFYTDCLGNGSWAIPEKVIDKELASRLVNLAQLLSKHPAVTARDIELWVAHMKPVWGRSLDDMQAALVEFCRAANGDKLADEMARFISVGLALERSDKSGEQQITETVATS